MEVCPKAFCILGIFAESIFSGTCFQSLWLRGGSHTDISSQSLSAGGVLKTDLGRAPAAAEDPSLGESWSQELATPPTLTGYRPRTGQKAMLRRAASANGRGARGERLLGSETSKGRAEGRNAESGPGAGASRAPPAAVSPHCNTSVIRKAEGS